MIKDNVAKFSECYGCTVCSLSCPHDIIKIKESDGFLRPVISDINKCTQCACCLKICSYNNRNKLHFTQNYEAIYSGVSRREGVINSTTSGGVVYELFKYALSNDYQVLAVEFNKEKNIATYYKASDLINLEKSKGSKYIQANLSLCKEDIDWNKKYFIIGTPCAIASFRKLIKMKRKEDNFVLLDFFCHGVPSLKLWNAYLKMRHVEAEDIDKVCFRPKDYGWHNSLRVKLKCADFTYITPPPKQDVFFKFFLGDRALQKSCYDTCVFKQLNSYADIRVGDLWGNKYMGNNQGVSGVVTMNKKGDSVVNSCTGINIQAEQPQVVLKGQMSKNATRAHSFALATFGLNHNIPLEYLNHACNIIDELWNLPKRVMNKLKRK